MLNPDRAARNHHIYAAVLRSSRSRCIVCNGVAHAITGGSDVVRADALRNEISTHRIASLLRKRQVVLIAAYIVGVTLYLYLQIRISEQNPGNLGEFLPGVGLERVFASVKQNVGQVHDQSARGLLGL